MAFDDGFLEWWLKYMEKKGWDLDGYYCEIAKDMDRPHLRQVYSPRQLVEAAKEGELWPRHILYRCYEVGMGELYQKSSQRNIKKKVR